jgi:hypothetical protein
MQSQINLYQAAFLRLLRLLAFGKWLAEYSH